MPLTPLTAAPETPVVVRVKSLNGAIVSTPVTGSEKVNVNPTLLRNVGLGSMRVIEATVGAVVSTTTVRGDANSAETLPAASFAQGYSVYVPALATE